MKRGVIWILLTCLMVTSLVLASCSSATTTSTSTIAITNTTTTTTAAATSTVTTPISTTSTAAVTTTATTTATGNWWDSLGTPSYGGTITLSQSNNLSGWDDANPIGGQQTIQNLWEDSLVCDNWTQDPSVFSYQLAFRPNNFEVGDVASDWEFSGPLVITMHLNQNVYWQNIAPVSGRQFVANDVVFYYDRIYGLGMGYTKPISTTTNTMIQALVSVVAVDKYTVNFTFQGVSQETIAETMFGPMGGTQEAPEVFAAYTSPSNPIITNWHNEVGAGPFILTDWVDNAALTAVANPTYWGHDERHPQNKLPYISGIKLLIIANQSTALAAVRTGKIDAIDGLTLVQSQQMKTTNPAMVQLTYPGGPYTIDPKNDVKPFSDIRVRQAMQMALNLPLIASTYYSGTASPYPSTMTSMFMTGWTYPYTSWPASLKATYDFNITGAKALLAAAGYANGFSTNIVASNTADLTLLQIVQSEFAAVGITMSITTMDTAALNTMLHNHANDQMAFNTTLGYTFPPLKGFQHWQTATQYDWTDVNDPSWNSLMAQALAAPTLTQTQALVYQANQYMASQQWEESLPTPSNFAVCEPWLKGYNAQTFSISGGNGILAVGFYCSRFWIDQNLKQSLGYGS